MRQLARRVEQGEVLLVRLHGENQAFLRDVQKLCFECTCQDVRPLDQGGHFVEQRSIVNNLHTTANARTGQRDLALDLVAPLGKPCRDRTITRQGCRIPVGVGKHDRRHNSFKTVAKRRPPGFEA